MNIIVLVCVFFLSAVRLFAQQSEPLRLQVIYQFTHVYDTAQRDSPLKEKQQLLIGANSNHYIRGTYVPATQPAMEKVAGAYARVLAGNKVGNVILSIA